MKLTFKLHKDSFCTYILSFQDEVFNLPLTAENQFLIDIFNALPAGISRKEDCLIIRVSTKESCENAIKVIQQMTGKKVEFPERGRMLFVE